MTDDTPGPFPDLIYPTRHRMRNLDSGGGGYTGFNESDVFVYHCMEGESTVTAGGTGTVAVTVRNDNNHAADFEIELTADGNTIGQATGNVAGNTRTAMHVNVTYPNTAGEYEIETTVTGASDAVD